MSIRMNQYSPNGWLPRRTNSQRDSRNHWIGKLADYRELYIAVLYDDQFGSQRWCTAPISRSGWGGSLA